MKSSMQSGWQPKRRLSAPTAPIRKPRFSKTRERQRQIELEDAEWLKVGGGPAPAEAPPSKLTCSPPSSGDEAVHKPVALEALVATVKPAVGEPSRDKAFVDATQESTRSSGDAPGVAVSDKNLDSLAYETVE